jgi:hypothetical protein
MIVVILKRGIIVSVVLDIFLQPTTAKTVSHANGSCPRSVSDLKAAAISLGAFIFLIGGIPCVYLSRKLYRVMRKCAALKRELRRNEQLQEQNERLLYVEKKRLHFVFNRIEFSHRAVNIIKKRMDYLRHEIGALVAAGSCLDLSIISTRREVLIFAQILFQWATSSQKTLYQSSVAPMRSLFSLT